MNALPPDPQVNPTLSKMWLLSLMIPLIKILAVLIRAIYTYTVHQTHK